MLLLPLLPPLLPPMPPQMPPMPPHTQRPLLLPLRPLQKSLLRPKSPKSRMARKIEE